MRRALYGHADDYDLIFKSPGVVLPKDPEQYSCRFTSQMEVFFEAYRDRIIGITGTKGKSTTTTLLYHILKKSGQDTVLAGNIGIPAFDILEEIHPDTRLVCELSCPSAGIHSRIPTYWRASEHS